LERPIALRLAEGRSQITEIDREVDGTRTLQSSPEYEVSNTDIMADQESPVSEAIVELFQAGDNLRMSGCLGKRSG
jgi:hypothetical protein